MKSTVSRSSTSGITARDATMESGLLASCVVGCAASHVCVGVEVKKMTNFMLAHVTTTNKSYVHNTNCPSTIFDILSAIRAPST